MLGAMYKIYYKDPADPTPHEISSVRPDCWVHVDQATEADLQEISQQMHIDYTDLLDCLDKYELPRIERSDQNLLIFSRYPTDQEIGLYTSTLTLIITPDCFVTISPHRSLLIQQFLDQLKPDMTFENTKLLVYLLLTINQEFTKKIRKIRYNVLSAEKEMIHVESEDITTLARNEEILNQYLASLAPLHTVLEGIRSGKYASLYEKERDLLEDCIHSTHQSQELCDIVIKSIRSLRNAYQIIFTNNLHKTIKLLTALTIILSIPTMIASVYGMNVNLPFAENTFAFVIVMGITLGISAVGLWVFKKKGWF